LGFDRLARVHVLEAKETEPVLLVVWDQLTVPVGAYPFTVTVQMTTVDEPTSTDFGVQETPIFVTFVVTTRLYVPEDGKFLESPP